MTPKWYLRRLASMGPMEILHRSEDAFRRRLWQRRPPGPPPRSAGLATFVVGQDDLVSGVDAEAAAALLAEAEELLAGRWTMFGRPRSDMTADLDYFVDFVNGTRAPDDRYSLTIDHRNEAEVGNIKFVWEAARHHHLTILAAAHAVSGDDRYAERIDRELRHYWRTNPFLTGIHWTSGIELGIRLISWVWIRRLLEGWTGASALFEANPVFVDQLGRHQQWLASLGSHGSSANNHVIAEAAGQFIASSAFPLFRESEAWQAAAAAELADQLDAQTFPDGLNRELASDYHGLVLELGVVAWVEAVLIGHPIEGALLEPLGRAVDALHAVVDTTGRPHRQGDSDDATGWLVDPIGYDRWSALLRTGALVVEPAPWWPADASDQSGSNRPGKSPVGAGSATPGDVRSAIVERCLAGRHRPAPPTGRPDRRPARFPDAGLTLLLAEARPGHGEGEGDSEVDDELWRGVDDELWCGVDDELWCMVDHGPLGFLSTAAHGHADALAIEIRCGGIEIVADPGTYCYHGDPAWRDHFRSTGAHATVTVADRDQSEMAGPFLWAARAVATFEASAGLDDVAVTGIAPPLMVQASHDGYQDLGLIHRRRVELDQAERVITIVDRLDPSNGGSGRPPTSTGPQVIDDLVTVDVVFPLGPEVEVDLDTDAGLAALRWDRPGGEGVGRASVTLDRGLSWSIARGVESPPAGWYSPRFGTKVPASLLLGRSSTAGPGAEYQTIIAFLSRPPGDS